MSKLWNRDLIKKKAKGEKKTDLLKAEFGP